MSRCDGWRPEPVPGHTGHQPGQCRACWRPCRNQVPSGIRVCDACQLAMATHPDQQVRVALATSEWVSSTVLDLLAEDGDFAVASSARNALEGMQHVYAG